MKIAKVCVKNFRGILEAEVLLNGHAVLVGDNNSGKSTLLEAIDLVLGPERLSKRPVIDEHDFYAGQYLGENGNPISITIEVVVVGLTEEQQRYFRNHLEWWTPENKLIDEPPPEGTDAPGVQPAIRLIFEGAYDKEEDDFIGNTYFASPDKENGSRDPFRTADKRECGFLFLRTLRTGSRALSLERGSLLDIILKLQEKRFQMWEDVLAELRELPVADKSEVGISDILSKVQRSVKSFVPAEWGDKPHMRVSDLTRENLRKVLTVFLGTGAIRANGTEYAAPFQHQGTGTINAMVLALLSMIAEMKQNVIFAMEEPEIAIPPHTQKRIVGAVRARSAQAIFTSHSPYVLEEFQPSQVINIHRQSGKLRGITTGYPPMVKPKRYREEMRRRFCEALLARRVLIVEGKTEFCALPAAARRLHELEPETFSTFEALGIALIDAETHSQIAPLATYFRNFEKTVFAFYDNQRDEAIKTAIEFAVPHGFESLESGFEKLITIHSSETALRRHGVEIVKDGLWPKHIKNPPTDEMEGAQIREVMREYFEAKKGDGAAAEFLAGCTREEMPVFLTNVIESIRRIAEPPKPEEEVIPPEPLVEAAVSE
jgi:putative ATP-dependent endonuclease of OLD family